MVVNNVRVLKPTLILDAKCASILGRANESKKGTDAADIRFLLTYIAQNRIPVGSKVTNASSEFIIWFISNYGSKDLFQRAGFTVPNSMFSSSSPSSFAFQTPRFIDTSIHLVLAYSHILCTSLLFESYTKL